MHLPSIDQETAELFGLFGARELAAMYGAPLRSAKTTLNKPGCPAPVAVLVSSPKGTPRWLYRREAVLRWIDSVEGPGGVGRFRRTPEVRVVRVPSGPPRTYRWRAATHVMSRGC